MAGIYVHIPFCRHKCAYCNFYSVASGKYFSQFVPVLIKEINIQKDYLKGEEIETVYFGGGTPSLLKTGEIDILLDSIVKHFKHKIQLEITLEANPDDLTIAFLNEIKKTGINRLSIGIQSFFDDDLEYLGRIHNSNDAINCLINAMDVGFTNLTADLIYGIPSLTNQKLKQNILKLVDHNIPHISAYALTVEPKTTLETWIKKSKRIPVDEEKAIEQFYLTSEILSKAGYLQYEISNYCLKGFEAKHNSNYWDRKNYLGIGPSAHSFNGSSRRWNVSNISKYIDGVKSTNPNYEEEILDENQKFNEYIMTSLRTMWGCNLELVRKEFGEEKYRGLISFSEKFIDQKLLELKSNHLLLTSKGKAFADGIASELFIVD